MLNTHRLRILREVHARGTINAAAEALFLTPSALSHQLAVLEREMGVPLLERTARSVSLTPAGERLVAHAETILAQCEEAVADLATYRKRVAGRLHLSVFQTAAQAFALRAAITMRKRYPKLEVLVSEKVSHLALAELKARQLDVAIAHEWDFEGAHIDPGIERHPLYEEPVAVLLPRSHPFANSEVHLHDLAEEPWCVALESASSRQAVLGAARAAGFEPHIAFESNYFRGIGAAVEAGLGVGLAPARTDLRGLDIAVCPLVEPAMNRRIFAATRAGSSDSPAIRAMLDALLDEAHSATLPSREGMS
jgi:DNA-binding transcriptional LysR family regulator